MSQMFSIAPDGERFAIPGMHDYPAELERLRIIAKEQRSLGREVVAVVGLGFVGAVMAAVVADSKNKSGQPLKFVIGIQRPSARSYWKIPWLNRGLSPVKAEDPEVARLIKRSALENKNLTATYNEDALKFADVVVVDVQCDFVKKSLGDVASGTVDMADLEKTFHVIAERIPPHALVLIETTVPPGTTERIAYPIIKEAFKRRNITSEPLLAHSFERVMPGDKYVFSIREYWRVCSGINEESKQRVVKFLNEVINTKDFPLTVLESTIESETAKILENSYRASILALMDEWSLFAERNGIDLIKVINAIKVRPSHNNMIFPGPGIGGYCLPKDGALGIWAYKNILGGKDNIFKFTSSAININDTRALHVAELTFRALKTMGKADHPTVAVLGASYKEDVGDTRNSGSEIIVRKLVELGADVRIHDPYVESWAELESQNGDSKSNYFYNQARLKNLRVSQNLDESLKGTDAVILAVRHKQYLALDPDNTVRQIGRPAAIVDCFGILDDNKVKRYLQLGCEVTGLGRGHIARIKNNLKSE